MDDVAPLFIFLVAAAICMIAVIATIAAIYSGVLSFKKDKEYGRIILCNNLFSAIILGIVAYSFASVGLYAFQKHSERSFYNYEGEHVAIGEVSRGLLIKMLSADENKKCDHVSKTDDKPLLIAISAERPVLCGASYQTLESGDTPTPYVRLNNQDFKVLIGTWPYNYELLIKDTKGVFDN